MHIAMILAAGRGERLKPITDTQPKALCLVHDVPLIEHHVMNLAKAGFQQIIINHAYLGGKIRQHLGNGARWNVNITYSPEPSGGLETGGGIMNALPLLGHEPFLVVNADIFTDYPFGSLALPSQRLAHLVLINKPLYYQQGDFGLSSRQQLENKNRQYTFAGIACYHPEAFKHCQPGRYSLTPLLRELTEHNKASGEIYTGKWIDIGSPERLQLANAYPPAIPE
ncbi:N-acetylmuramate alpha-1-phosphate uridylyltransferase MurU [Legionella oakridgensis]|uniref:Nucleoside-diphosphate-sugar pyrophosphorylase n=2 Tax=Legionella oakridgensis TaxID=29423 RepID=W0B5Z7_9GAMM|nr:nucleotidyltransferase family protein [Legionella oakridgensis]AHE65948.1 nucleoside-diphosphate-sugar pyrophosphorylase [Legionella oakridgensis ATCC 33761 = DSM 21215]ETO94319.1 nucleoside-diphosphate-sugar pyrophosphorylase involved in lipopolysaccharide biosynthesis [Legionella oakridgensis RV-2-2007]KTD43798.1 mannose-1-phosphate guanyltransferase [Legionella oakridgensis]STY15876.1 mannose-1-phosphate guanylyltransferase [Legionella longbeachae]